MQIQASQYVQLSFVLDEDEARAVLVDPRDFQGQLRQALAEAHANGKGPSNGKNERPLRARAERGRAGHATRSAGSFRCNQPECGRTFVNRRALNIHRKRTHGEPPAGETASA